MYRHWKQDPKSVHVSWATYFSGLDKGVPSSSAYSPPPGFIGAASSAVAAGPSRSMKGDSELTDYLKVSHVVIRCLDSFPPLAFVFQSP